MAHRVTIYMSALHDLLIFNIIDVTSSSLQQRKYI